MNKIATIYRIENSIHVVSEDYDSQYTVGTLINGTKLHKINRISTANREILWTKIVQIETKYEKATGETGYKDFSGATWKSVKRAYVVYTSKSGKKSSEDVYYTGTKKALKEMLQEKNKDATIRIY